MTGEILPAVGIPDIAGARAREAAITGQGKRAPAFPRDQIITGAGIVVPATAVEMRGEQGVEGYIFAGEGKATSIASGNGSGDSSNSRRYPSPSWTTRGRGI